MRKIKFRFYSNFDKKMYQLSLMDLHTENRDELCVYEGSRIPSNYIEDGRVQNSSDGHIMQYTGLKDKNGTEIYEGDIVKWTQTLIETGLQKFIGKVEFYEGAYWIDNDEKAIGLFDEFNPVEVIGNIYENPELLKDG